MQSPISAAANRRARFGRLVINRVIICSVIRSPLPALTGDTFQHSSISCSCAGHGIDDMLGRDSGLVVIGIRVKRVLLLNRKSGT